MLVQYGTSCVVLLLLSFLHLTSCIFPSAQVDPRKCKKPNGDFPKLGSFCRSFYRCNNWIPREMICPSDQHFFPAKGYCVWPEEFPCLDRPDSEHCPEPNGKFLKPGTNCKVYYDCCYGRPSEKSCPGDTLFDSSSQKCDWPELVICQDDQDPTSEECPLASGNFLKSGTRCKYYYECNNFKPTVKKCSGDTIFDQSKGKCDWPELVDCADDESTTKTTFSSTLGTTTRTEPSTPTPGTTYKITTPTSYPTYSKTPTPDSREDSSEEGKTSEESKEPTYPTISTVARTISEEITTTSMVTDLKETPTSTIQEETDLPATSPQSASSIATSTEPSTPSPDTTDKITTPTSSYSKTPTPDSHEDSSEEGKTSEESKESTYPTISTVAGTISEEITTTSMVTDLKETPSSTIREETDLPATSPQSSSSVATSTETKSIITTVLEDSTVSEMSSSSTSSIDTTTHPAVSTDETSTTTTDDVNYRDRDSTTTTSSLTDVVTYHIFCPKPDGYFPHPSNKHQFIACVGGRPTVMDCPSKLVYNHKTKSCQYERKKNSLNLYLLRTI